MTTTQQEISDALSEIASYFNNTVDEPEPGEFTIADALERYGQSEANTRRKIERLVADGVLTKRTVVINGSRKALYRKA